ncbi:unnamed protein product, partial [Rangifer tarandus platyrhynchus]
MLEVMYSEDDKCHCSRSGIRYSSQKKLIANGAGDACPKQLVKAEHGVSEQESFVKPDQSAPSKNARGALCAA